MEERYKMRFTDKVKVLASNKYGVDVNDLDLVGTHQSFVYKAIRDEEIFFIRIIHSDHRSKEQIIAELEWVKYLDKNKISVSTPIESLEGNEYELVKNEEDLFIVVAFTQAIGFGIGEQPWSEERPKQLGILTAKMHNLAEEYTPKRSFKRDEWYSNSFISKAEEYLPSQQTNVMKALNKLVEDIKRLPIDSESYGLIHSDLVACNYHIDSNNRVTFFDFDESCYCWYIYDIAVQLFYWSLGARGTVDRDETILVTKKFFEGYKSVRNIDSYWIEKLPLFLRLREMILYIAIHRSRDLSDLDYWTENFLKDRQRRIENEVPFVEIDFADMARELSES